MSSWAVALLAAVARKPMLLTQHVAMVEHSSKFVMGVQRLVYATIGKWIFSKARSIFVYNENVRAFLHGRRVPAERIRFLANGVDTRLFRTPTPDEQRSARTRFGLPPDRPLVLFVGRLVEKKGFQILLQAKDPAFDLVFAGSGTVPAAGRVPGVHWLGPLGQAELAELYHACDVFAFPAVGEIFTLVMQEAMACGLPVVTTDDPAYTGSIVADSCVVCPRDADSFRNALKALLLDAGRRALLSERSRQVAVRRFDWRANFGPLLDAYADVIGPPHWQERKV
jgi:glycosyltransferase involved in cell wall biosynthesis